MALTLLHRFLFFGLHGLLDEIVFTSFHDFILVRPDYALRGHSSVWSFFIYGSGSLLVEYMYKRYCLRNLSIFIRGIAYISIAFFWEFSTGLFLKQFSACPWDYTHKDFDFMGLITLDYAPFWCLAGFYQEYLTEFLDSLRMVKSDDSSLQANGYITKHD